MGTRADFYVGRGLKSEWLGSIAWDGYPEGLDEKEAPGVLSAKSPEAFRASVTTFLEKRKDGTLPSMGWPWPWEDSRTTDFSYSFDEGNVWVSCFDNQWLTLDNLPKGGPASPGPNGDFPDMKAVQKVDLGKRSGIMILG